MPIPPYPRMAPPPEHDYTQFGTPVNSSAVLDEAAAIPGNRTIVHLATMKMPASIVHGRNFSSGETHFLQQAEAEFSYGYAGPMPGIAFLPEHAVLVDGSNGASLVEESLWHSELFYSDFARNDRNTDWKWRINRPAVDVTLHGEVAFCYHRFYYNYFHWLFDCLPRVWLLRSKSPFGRIPKWYLGPLPYAYQQATIDLFELSAEALLPPVQTPCAFEGMILPAFRFADSLRTRPSYSDGIQHKGWSPVYVDELADRALVRANARWRGLTRKIYLSRSGATHRRLSNESSVASMMIESGFDIVDPAQLSFWDQVRLFASADLVVGTHGAGLSNLLWMKRGSKVLEFIPRGLDDAGYRFLANLKGIEHHALFGEPSEHDLGLAFADLRIDTEALSQALKTL